MKRQLTFVSSIIILITYLAFAILARLNYPGLYSASHNWLSDLGSPDLNPHGALFYNIGIVLTGLVLLPFFWGLSEWAHEVNRVQNAMLFLTRLFGCLGAVAMLMSAVFPITIPAAHSFLSASLYILLGTAFAFSVATLRYYPRYPKSLLVIGVFVALEDMLFGMILNTYLFEWLTVALLLGYVLLLGIVTWRKTIYVQPV